MLPLALGALGVSGVAYLLLRYFWPTFYLDWIYHKRQKRIGEALLKAVEAKKLFVDIFEDKVKECGAKSFIVYQDSVYSYEQMDRRANQVAHAALEIGLKPGDNVAVLCQNEPGIVWTYLGFSKAGVKIAFINFNLRSRSLAHCINVSGAKILVVGQGQALVDAVYEVLPEIPDITVYLQGKTDEQKPPPFFSFETIMSRMSQGPVDRSLRKHINLLTPAVYIYTSGTTGLPKPAIVPQIRLLAAGNMFNTFGMTLDDIIYEPLPFYHSAALLVGFGNTVTKGATMVLKDKFSASQFWQDCRKHDVTIINYIGEVCRYLVSRPKDKMDGVHKIKYAFGNGMRQDIWAEFQNRFRIPQIVEFYGATEAPIAFYNLTNKFGSCGRSSPFLRKRSPAAFVKFDLESQSAVRNKFGRCIPIGTDEVGLLIIPLIPGKTAFSGYRGSSEATKKKILTNVFEEGDQFFNTGDLMKVDCEYYLYFNDRVGDTFRWKGENVSTTEVSNTLTDLDFIHDANVYGVLVPGGDGRAGMATLTLMDETATGLTPAQLVAVSKHAQEALPSYARPRFIRVKKELDLTSTFKQQKMSLVKEGFDITKMTDPVYFLNSATQTYMPLDHIMYVQIMAGKIPM